MVIVACNEPKEKQDPKMNSNCEALKSNIQKEFDLKNFSKTIYLYKTYENCSDNKEEFLMKLALLYKANGQQDLCNKQLNKVIRFIKRKIGQSRIEKSLAKANIYLIMDDKLKLKNELNKLNKRKLTQTQTEEVEFLELFANQGEFITGSLKADFELFD